MNNIPYGKQHITEEDIRVVVETLTSEYLTQGPKIKEFEDVFADYIGSKYAVAVSNGTAALHLCALALNLNSNTRIITTPITFVASANGMRYCGAEIYFADIDPDTFLLDLKSVRALLEKHPKNYFHGIVAVDFAGRAVNLQQFRSLANEFGLWIIEDACHAPGGYFIDDQNKNQHCGNGNFAELAVFSFHPVKHIATGEGGMITTNDSDLYNKLMMLRTHGITRNVNQFQNTIEFATGEKFSENYPGWYMEMQELGYNYRLTDLQAALGISQLKRANEGLKKRRDIAKKYDLAFAGNPKIKIQASQNSEHAYHLYVIEAENRLAVYNHLRKQQIFAQIHYIPAHLMPYYRSQGWKEGDLPMAESYYKKCISLPMYPTLTDEEQNFVIQSINDIL